MHGVVIQGEGLQEIKFCTRMDYRQRISIQVKRCTAYRNKHEITLHDMEKLAWLIEINKNTIGFHQPKSDKHKEFQEQWRHRDYVDPMADH